MVEVFWHRRDLRLRDNVGLSVAASEGTVVPVFVVDDALFERLGRRQRAFLLANARALRAAYRERGSDLVVGHGRPEAVLDEVRSSVGAGTVHYNRHYRPERRERQRAVADALPAREHVDLVLVDPRDLDERYRSHSQFRDDWDREPKPDPRPAPDGACLSGVTDGTGLPEAETDLDGPDPGYAAARERYDRFLAAGIGTYADTRDDMAAAVEAPTLAVSRLSPYLAAGAIGIREVWADAAAAAADADGDARRNAEKYCDELTWRESNYHLLEHNPALLTEAYEPFPRGMTWENDPEDVAAWKAGRTGYPLVDAGMRQLREEGYVHNRPRQVVASFLTKHLLVDWRVGADYFAQSLVDFDPANNYGNWQWIAGTGTDTVDVRIFDPVAQMAKYDDGAQYVKAYVPELRSVPPGSVVDWPTLERAERDRLAPSYPDPVVDRDGAYERARRRYEAALGRG
jgi:deoxyribodipyrimidine photo-lyase